MPTAPQFMQTLGPVPAGFAQPRPVLHVLPGQQLWPSPPQGWQVMPPSPAWHERPARQLFAAPLPLQHGWPVLPHATHIMAEHCAPAPVHVMPVPVPQQAWPTAPHAMPPIWHEPFVHMPEVPLPAQVAPAAMQSPPTQQPPLLHVFAAQQA